MVRFLVLIRHSIRLEAISCTSNMYLEICTRSDVHIYVLFTRICEVCPDIAKSIYYSDCSTMANGLRVRIDMYKCSLPMVNEHLYMPIRTLISVLRKGSLTLQHRNSAAVDKCTISHFRNNCNENTIFKATQNMHPKMMGDFIFHCLFSCL